MTEKNNDYLIAPSRAVLARGNKDEIIRYIQSEHWIGYNEAIRVLMKLDELLNYPKRQRMPNLLVIGPTNNGKTMIARKFCKIHPLKKSKLLDERGHPDVLKELPVLYMQMPSNPDARRFYAAIFHELNESRMSAFIAERLFETNVWCHMEVCSVRLLMIDEIHNILSGRKNQQHELLNVLRYLGNKLQIPIVGFGTKDAYLAIRADDQLENRFEPYLLPAWKSGKEYDSLLASFVSLMPLKKKSNLNDPQLSKKILTMSEGILGEIITIIIRAAVFATRTSHDEIDDSVLSSIEYASPSTRKKIFERGLL